MKKTVLLLLALTMIMVSTACSASKEKPILDRIRDCSVALMESSDGTAVIVWNTQDLATLASLEIQEAALEPADIEDDWLYRIIFDPRDKVVNGEEITVSFHNDYIQIGSEFYLPKQGADCSGILGWAGSKFEYLVKEYGAE